MLCKICNLDKLLSEYYPSYKTICKKCLKQKQKIYHETYKNTYKYKIYRKKRFYIYYHKYRTKILEFFGNKCKKCGFNDIRALQVDHINGGGHKERRENYRKKYYEKIIDNPDKYQLLCANCNCIKRIINNENRKV